MAAVDPTTAGVQRILTEELAKQLWQTARPGGDDASPATKAYDSLFSQTLADAIAGKDAAR